MVTDEQKNLGRSARDLSPPGGGMSIVAKAIGIDPDEALQMVEEVWRVFAAWGRYCDDDLGDWPSDEQALKQLPTWVLHSIPDIVQWFDDLHDRDWIWWNGNYSGNIIKIDLLVESFPVSIFIIRQLVESLGCEIIYDDKWLSLSEASQLDSQ